MKTTIKWLLPLLLLGAIAPFTPTLDLKISSLFYTPASVGKGAFYNNAYLCFLYEYGESIGFGCAIFALLILALSFWKKSLKKWRPGALAFVLTLIVGAGLITNVMFKEHWGRPRPKQIVEFGGTHTFRPFWSPNFHTRNDPQKSFPSGHVALGFYFLSLFLVGKRYQSKSLTYFGLIMTLFFGGSLIIARITQGGHFLSDTLIAPVIMWWTALFFDYWFFIRRKSEVPLPEGAASDTSPVTDGV